MSKKYRVRVSPNGMQKSAFRVLTGVGALYRAFTGTAEIKESFNEEARLSRRRRRRAISRQLFK